MRSPHSSARFRTCAAVAALVAAALVAGAPARAAQADRADAQGLVSLETAWNDAFYRKDLAFIRTLLADEFIATYEDGSQGDKAKELLLTYEFNQQVDSAKQDDFVVKIYGDTAVVWFTLHLVGPRQGQEVAVDLRYVDVFVWREGRWQCVSSHSTRVAKTP
jgi:ketosteroid isomerase-like protein